MMWISKLFFALSIFGFLNCGTARKLNVETIESTYIAASKTNERGAHVRYRKRVPLTEVLEPKIYGIEKQNKSIKYKIQGHITTGGHTINRIKTIKTEKDVIGDTLYIRHHVLIKRIPGKEGANVMGQNYNYTHNTEIPNQISTIKIELYTDNVLRKSLNQIKILTEKEVSVE